jgi:hypothetical protein
VKPSEVGPLTYPGVPSLERIEWIVLGDIYAFTLTEDRGPAAMMPRDADPITGLPKDEAPRAIIDPVTGAMLGMTLGSKLRLPSMATGGMDLACSIVLWAGSVDPEGGYTPGLSANHISFTRNGRKIRLSDVPRSQWPPGALEMWREWAFRLRQVFMRWAARGLVDPQPILYEKPEPLGLDLLPRVVRPKATLVNFAKRVIPGTPWANRPHSILHDLTATERLSQPAYARESFAKEAGGSAETPLIDKPIFELGKKSVEEPAPTATEPAPPPATTKEET